MHVQSLSVYRLYLCQGTASTQTTCLHRFFMHTQPTRPHVAVLPLLNLENSLLRSKYAQRIPKLAPDFIVKSRHQFHRLAL